jgi:hypothetical protein
MKTIKLLTLPFFRTNPFTKLFTVSKPADTTKPTDKVQTTDTTKQTTTMETLHEKVSRLNQMILNGKILEAFEEFYAENVSMQENENPPTVGKAACRINEENFVTNITAFRGARVKNVIVSDDLSAVEWHFDFTHKDWGVRNYDQLAVQRWKDGKIIGEKFYYNY